MRYTSYSVRRSAFFQTLFKASVISIALLSVSPAEVIADAFTAGTHWIQPDAKRH